MPDASAARLIEPYRTALKLEYEFFNAVGRLDSGANCV